jgi:hypothetical protein
MARKVKSESKPIVRNSSRRCSERILSSGKKSRYFEGSDSDDDEDELVRSSHENAKSMGKDKRRKGGEEEEDDFEEPQSEVDGDDVEDASFDDEPEAVKKPASKKRGRPSGPAKPTPQKRSMAKRRKVESDEEDDDDDEPQVEFIPLPKLKDTKGIEYGDDRIHPNTMDFLKELKANNKRDWLKSMYPRPCSPTVLI